MNSFQFFPIAKQPYRVEVIICSTFSQMQEYALDIELEEDDNSLFILNKTEIEDKDKIGTLLFLRESLDKGTVVNQSTRVGITFARILAGLVTQTGDRDLDEAIFDKNASEVSQEVFNQIEPYLHICVPEYT